MVGVVTRVYLKDKMSAKIVSQATKDKMSASNTGNGKIVSQETRDKMSAPSTGKIHSQATKDKMSAKIFLHETRDKMSASQKQRIS